MTRQMQTHSRPAARDWAATVAAGAGLGLLLLGLGARAGMRVVALAAHQSTAFTIAGSVAVTLLSALTGAAVAIIFLLARTAVPRSRWGRGMIFWTLVGALTLRGLSPVTVVS